MIIVLNIILVILLFGLTVFVHELGHYLVARWLGLVVDVFSIGFGPSIWKKKINGIVYKVGCLPVGGYVSLPQLDPSQVKAAKEEGRKLPKVAAWKKIPVAFAGAFSNVLLALLIAYVVYWVGKTQVYDEHDAVIGYVETNSAAYAAGVRPGDVILAVNSEKVNRWDEFIIESALTTNAELTIKKRSGATETIAFDTEAFEMGGRFVDGLYKQMSCLIISVFPGGSASEAGLKPNDIVREFAGTPIYSVPQLTEIIDEYRGKAAPIVVSRKGVDQTFMVTPEYNEAIDRALIGIEFNTFDIYKKPFEQLMGWASPVFRILKAVVTPSKAKHVASSVGGPLAIFDMIWKSIQISYVMAIWFIGMLNVNLAILNLLPIPVLDGGHIIFALWEVVTRKAVPEKVVNGLTTVFGTLLITLLLLLTLKDAHRFWKRAQNNREAQSQEQAVEAAAPVGEVDEK